MPQGITCMNQGTRLLARPRFNPLLESIAILWIGSPPIVVDQGPPMSEVFLNVLPIFILILTGWLVVRFGYLTPAVGEALGDFVFRIAVPVLLFRTIAEADFKEGSPWPLWLAYFSGVAVTWTVGHLAATLGFGRDPRMGVLAGVSSAFANTVFIGLPLVSRVVGEEGIVALSILLSVHLPVMMIAGTVFMERAGEDRRRSACRCCRTRRARLYRHGARQIRPRRQYRACHRHQRTEARRAAGRGLRRLPSSRLKRKLDRRAGADFSRADGRQCLADRQPFQCRPRARLLDDHADDGARRHQRFCLGLSVDVSS
jgi:hypothetical protein